MPTITKITEQKRRPNRRNIHLDGKFAFGVNLNVVAQFRLREGMSLSAEQVAQIEQGELRQEVFDKAMEYLGQRLHSRSELQRKLKRREYGDAVVEAVLENLERLGYLNDERFAHAKALSAAQHKHHGRRRAYVELVKSGVEHDVAHKALDDVYEAHDSLAAARLLARKQAPRLRKLDPPVARRRLVGMLLRRGYSYNDIRPVIDEVLGPGADDEPPAE
jgi:regulatory protein